MDHGYLSQKHPFFNLVMVKYYLNIFRQYLVKTVFKTSEKVFCDLEYNEVGLV